MENKTLTEIMKLCDTLVSEHDTIRNKVACSASSVSRQYVEWHDEFKQRYGDAIRKVVQMYRIADPGCKGDFPYLHITFKGKDGTKYSYAGRPYENGWEFSLYSFTPERSSGYGTSEYYLLHGQIADRTLPLVKGFLAAVTWDACDKAVAELMAKYANELAKCNERELSVLK